MIHNAFASLPKCSGPFSRTYIIDDFWWISGVLANVKCLSVRVFKCPSVYVSKSPSVHVSMWGECFARLSAARGVPKSDATLVNTLSHKVSHGQVVSKWSIFDCDYNDFWRRFQLCPPQVLNPSADGWQPPRFVRIWDSDNSWVTSTDNC